MTNQTENCDRGDIDRNVAASPATAEAIVELVHVVMHQFRSLQFQALKSNEHELTHMESKVMGFFARRPGATVTDLAAHSGRDKAQLAKLIKGLRERGLLEAQVDDADKRITRIQQSAMGRTMQHAVHAQGQVLNRKAVRGLSVAEQTQLAALLDKVKANLDAPE